jgi:hypothetical protein
VGDISTFVFVLLLAALAGGQSKDAVGAFVAAAIVVVAFVLGVGHGGVCE